MPTTTDRRRRSDPLPPELAERLRAARLASGLGVRPAGRSTGLAHSTVVGYESRLWAPSRTAAERLAEVYGLDVEFRAALLDCAAVGVGYDYPGRVPPWES